MKKFIEYVFLLVAGIWTSVSYGDVIFTAPPLETEQQGRDIYEPIAEHLSLLLNRKVVYKHPSNWLQYEYDMQKDKYDIVFDAAHLVSWRIKKLGATPIARLPGHSGYFILTRKNNSKVVIVSDLIGKKICGIAPPNLGTLTVYEHFPNPVRQPIIHVIEGGFVELFDTFKRGECVAVVLRENVYENKLTAEERANMKIIVSSPRIPNQGMTASKRISPEEIQIITRSLTRGAGVEASKRLLACFAKNKKAFVSTTKAEFEGYSKYMEGVSIGW